MGTKQVIEWKKPKDIEFGEALGDKQLNARLTTGNGKLSYKPDKGHQPEVGKCVLTVTASKTKDFDETTEKVDLMVVKAKQQIEWKAPAAITYGDELGDKQLNAKLKEGDGDLSYTPKLKTVLDAGKSVLKVTASATKNHVATEAEVTLVVEKAKPVIVWKDPKPVMAGELLSASELNAVLKEGDGKLVYSRAIGDRVLGGTHTLRVDVAATKNCEAASATVTLLVMPVVQLIEVDLPADIPALSTANEVRDVLFPASGNKGFHITLEYQDGETSLKNPHVYRDLATIYKGQGVTCVKDAWTALEKALSKRLDAELVKLKNLIVASKWCPD